MADSDYWGWASSPLFTAQQDPWGNPVQQAGRPTQPNRRSPQVWDSSAPFPEQPQAPQDPSQFQPGNGWNSPLQPQNIMAPYGDIFRSKNVANLADASPTAYDALAARSYMPSDLKQPQYVTPEEQAAKREKQWNGGKMAVSTVNPWAGAVLNAATGDYKNAGIDAAFGAMPYVAPFVKPFLKPAAATAAAGAAILMPDAQGSSAEAKEKKNQAPGTQTAAVTPGPSASPVAAPQGSSLEDQEAREISQLQADRDKAIEQGKHSKQPPGEKSMMAQAADNYNTAAQATKDRYRDLRNLRDFKQTVLQDSNPEFAGLPPGRQTEISQQPTAISAQDLYNKYVNENRPFAQQHPGAVAAAEAAGFGLGTYLPFRGASALGRQVAKTEGSLAKAGSSVVPNPIYENRLNTQAGKLQAQVDGSHNFLTEHVLPLAGHTAVGAALPYFAGTVAPNLMDTFTKPHDSASYKHAVSMFDPTNPEAQDALKRAAEEGGVAALAGHGLGHGLNSTALSDAKGVLGSVAKRTAGYDAPVGMRTQATPMQQAMSSPAAVGTGNLSKASSALEDNFGVAGRVTGDTKVKLPRQMTNPRKGSQFQRTIRIDRGND